MSTGRLPRTLDEVDEAWLSTALAVRQPGTRVAGVRVAEVIAGSATKARLAVDYHDNPAGLPGTVVLKAGFDPVMRELAVDLYRNEATFFSTTADALDIRLPRWFFAGADEGQGAIVFEDLRATAASFGDMLQPLEPELAAEALTQLARVHARFWGDTGAPEVASLRSGAVGQQVVVEALLSEANWGRCADLGRFDGLPVGVTDRARVSEAVLGLLGPATEGPGVLVHGDAHLGNLWFDATGRPGWLDWQAAGPGAWDADAAYFLVGALAPEVRREHERDLLGAYLTELRRAGVADPPAPDAAWRAYLHRLPYGMLGLLCTPEMQSEAFCRAMGRRFATAIDDHGVL